MHSLIYLTYFGKVFRSFDVKYERRVTLAKEKFLHEENFAREVTFALLHREETLAQMFLLQEDTFARFEKK